MIMDGIKAHSLELTLLSESSRHLQQQKRKKKMKLMLLVVCSVIATSLAGPYSDKEAQLETVLK